MKTNLKRSFALVAVLALILGIVGCQKGASVARQEGSRQGAASEPSIAAEELVGRILSRSGEQSAENSKIDRSDFVGTFGTVQSDLVIRFCSDGERATLTFDGRENSRAEGRLVVGDHRISIGERSYRYAFFNDYLLLGTDSAGYILYKESSIPWLDASVALFRAEKTGSNELLFEDGRVYLNLPAIGRVTGDYQLDRGVLKISGEKSLNYALSAKVTASSTESGSNQPQNAVDGKSGTRWSSEYADGQSLTLELDGLHTVSYVRLFWETAAAKDFRILTSVDGTDWKEVFSEDENSIQEGYGDYSFDPVEASYVRLEFGSRLTSYGVSLYEVEIYGSYFEPMAFRYSVDDGGLVLEKDGKKYAFAYKKESGR